MKDSIQAKHPAAFPRPATPAKAGAKGKDAPPAKNWKKLALLALGLLLLLSGIVWAVTRPPNPIAKYKELEEAVRDQSLSPEERREKGEALREQGKKLTERDRAILDLERQEKQNVQLREYAAMTPEQKREHLKNEINKREQRRAQGGGNPGRGAQGGGVPGGQVGAGGQPGGQPGADGPGGRGPGRRGGAPNGQAPGQAVDANGQQAPPQSARSLEDRHDRAKTRLDFTTPEDRGLRDQYRSDMAAMRKTMGLPVTPGAGMGGGGGPRGGGGPPGGPGGGPRGPRG